MSVCVGGRDLHTSPVNASPFAGIRAAVSVAA